MTFNASRINETRALADAMLAIRCCRHGTTMFLRQDRCASKYVGRSFAEDAEYSEG